MDLFGSYGGTAAVATAPSTRSWTRVDKGVRQRVRATWRLGEPEHREEVLHRLDELVVKPVDGSGGKGSVIGLAADRAELDVLRRPRSTTETR